MKLLNKSNKSCQNKLPTLQDVLVDIQAQKIDTYYKCVCPSCQKNEAFFYLTEKSIKSGVLNIHCNRLNHCGEKTILHFKSTNEIAIDASLNQPLPNIDSKYRNGYNKKAVEYLIRNLCNTKNHCYVPEFYRGISKSILLNNIIFFPKGIKSLFGSISKHYFPTEFYTKSRFNNRDIIIPLKNQKGQVERLLLRSSQKSPLKEFQIKFFNNSNEIWNIQDLYNQQKKYLFICEGIIDALSIKEVLKGTPYEQNVGVIALIGVLKHNQVIRALKKYLKKQSKAFVHRTIYIAFDYDKAGLDNAKKFKENLIRIGVGGRCFMFDKAPLDPLEKSIKNFDKPGTIDMNRWLEKDKQGFKKAVLEQLW